MGATLTDLAITEPGIYPDLPDAVYHADPVPTRSLSSTGARKILTSCPAIFQHERTHGGEPRRAFDLGHAAHELVLGVGGGITVIDAADYRTNAAKEARDAAREAGKTPLLAAEWQVVQDMAAAIRAHRLASALLNPEKGRPEQSMFWPDEQTGVWRRARLDWMPDRGERRTIVADYKTAASADPREFPRSAANFGYHQQAAWYVDGLQTLRGDDDIAFVFVVQEKTAPYVVSVIQLDAESMAAGRRLNRKALDVYAACDRTGYWPGYSDDVALVGLPRWYQNRIEEEL